MAMPALYVGHLFPDSIRDGGSSHLPAEFGIISPQIISPLSPQGKTLRNLRLYTISPGLYVMEDISPLSLGFLLFLNYLIYGGLRNLRLYEEFLARRGVPVLSARAQVAKSRNTTVVNVPTHVADLLEQRRNSPPGPGGDKAIKWVVHPGFASHIAYTPAWREEVEEVGLFLTSSFVGLVAMTSASHAEGRQFNPGTKYFFKIWIVTLIPILYSCAAI